jgi:uncharacterized protein (DUF2249 family)
MTSTPTSSIDVREIPPPQRHSLIFGRFDALQPGEVLQLTNDHDPKPLRLQLESRSANQFQWAYLQSGPDLWQVQITKVAKAPAAETKSGSCCGSCGG